jgi:integrase
MKFTMLRVGALECPEGQKDKIFFDDELPGFGVRVSRGGGKTFIAQYRAASGVRRVPLGRFEQLSLDDARKRAKEILGAASGGRDPVQEKRVAKEAQLQAAADARFTLEVLIDAWAADRGESRRASYIRIAVGALKTHLKPLLQRPAGIISVREAVAALDAAKASAGPVAANRLLSYARAAYGWANKRQRLQSNPFAGLERPVSEKSRERVLSDAEIGTIWRAASAVAHPGGPFTKILLLTLARREEVASMRWSEISGDGATWTLPSERAKNGKAHIVHLSEPAQDILKTIPRFDGSDFVFTSTGKVPVSGFSFFKRNLEKAMTSTGSVPMPDWRFHDFRRAGVTWLAGHGFAPHVADKLLNHVGGTISGVAAVYQKAEFIAERKAALEAWSKHILASAEGRTMPENVVDLKRA